jgi:hypothetical protein
MNPTWRKSSHSNGTGECVELACLADLTAVRDSKNAAGPSLLFPRFESFVAEIKAARFDR